MTVVILDPGDGALPPYPRWLYDAGSDLVLVTGRAGTPDTDGYTAVVAVDGYRSTATVERAVLRLAGSTGVSALVAVADCDAIRAGALRDHLCLPGPGRDRALRWHDLLAMRRHLKAHAVAAVPAEPVRRVADVYRCAHDWDGRVRVRQRRPAGWPTVALLDADAVAAFTRDGLASAPELVPNLVLEPRLRGTRARITAVRGHDGAWRLLAAAARGGRRAPRRPAAAPSAAARAALRALAPDGTRAVVDLVGTGAGPWRVDAVRVRPDRRTVRLQAGLPAEAGRAGG